MEIAALSAALATPAAAGPATVEPSTRAAEQFNALMNAPENGAGVQPAAQPGQADGVQAAIQAAFAPSSSAPPTMGAQILQSLQSTAGEFSQKWQNISTRFDQVNELPTVVDMLRLQTDLLQVAVQYELVGKGVARTTQNVDSIVKMQ